MHSLLQFIIFILAFISYEHMAMAQWVPPYTSVVAPITKQTDTNTSFYSVDIMTRWVNTQFWHANFLIDINAPLTWYNCIVQWNIYPGSCPENTICSSPVSCEEYQCTDVRASYSYDNPSCPPADNSSTLPGWGYCTCPVNVVNPVTGSCGQPMLNYDEFTVNTSNGRNPLSGFYGAYPNAACAPSSLFESFPANVTGVMGFSTSPYAMPAYLYQPLKRNLALCLPSNSSAPGVLFFGSGPYYFPPHSDVDVSSLLSYTPLLKHQDSFGYFIGVKNIFIKGIPIKVVGNNPTKISSTMPYTTLRTDLYNPLVQKFSVATRKFRRESAVKPFSFCLNTSAHGHYKKKVLQVPDIVLGLEDGKNWTISGTNSMKKITEEVSCLAFVDGGMTVEHPIVIGTFQMEDNFLQFDLENSTLGFSSSLLHMGSSCSNFNFTTGTE